MSRLSVKFQSLVSRISVPITYGGGLVYLWGILGYRWENLKAFRAKIKSLLQRHDGPLIICPNHLTMIDSLLLLWAMTPAWKAITKPHFFPWNTPEKKNFAHNAILKTLCYIGKCVPVERQGPPNRTQAFLEKVKGILARRQSIMLFPEGTRSSTGRIETENFAYGIGKIIDDLRKAGHQPKVLCLYLRGKSDYWKTYRPPRGEKFFIDAEPVDLETAHTGMRAARDLATQIIHRLVAMETKYFSRQRPRLA